MGEGPNSHGKHSKYIIEDGEIVGRKDGEFEKKFCPECGPGVFLGVHSDRKVCGKCGYTVKKSD
tara:strand:+ start:34834 stop:35025 length:192 start_codon:yes stop_codon:yes gene_type:complete